MRVMRSSFEMFPNCISSILTLDFSKQCMLHDTNFWVRAASLVELHSMLQMLMTTAVFTKIMNIVDQGTQLKPESHVLHIMYEFKSKHKFSWIFLYC